MRRWICVLAFPAMLLSEVARADPPPAPWEFSLTPYLWLPSVDASMRYDTPGSGGTPVDMTNLLQALKAALFLSGEARKGRWGLTADLVFCDFGKTSSNVTTIGGDGQTEVPINSGTTTTLTGYMVSFAGNYSLAQWPDGKLDLLGGLRYTHVGTTLDWSFTTPVADLPGRSGSAERSVDLWDGVVGVRGNTRFGGGGKWFVPYYLDAGAGTSKFTWQALAGVGYSFGWGDLLLVYRYLSFEQGAEHPVEHLSFSGPALGATFHF